MTGQQLKLPIRLVPRRLWATEAQLDIQLELPASNDCVHSPPSVRLIGPYWSGRRTVASVYTATLTERRGRWLTYRAVVTEPCYWSPAEPYRYCLQVARGSGTGIDTLLGQAMVGLRHLAIGGNGFLLTGRRWQPRACYVAGPVASAEEIDRMKAHGWELVVGRVTAVAADRAAELGVALFAVVGPEEAAAAIGELSDVAAVLAWVATSEAAAAVLHRHDPVRLIGCVSTQPVAGAAFQIVLPEATLADPSMPTLRVEELR